MCPNPSSRKQVEKYIFPIFVRVVTPEKESLAIGLTKDNTGEVFHAV